uniref:Uncharacterized protein n=1 Tax=viral metagenome TaxID=1070528 RepID=A0A6M3KVG6_9ZZZZ
MPYPQEHSCRISPPENYEKFRRGKRKHEGKEYSVIYGKLKDENKWEDQAFRYDKEVWEADDAKTHCKDHDGTFEAATDTEKTLVFANQAKMALAAIETALAAVKDLVTRIEALAALRRKEGRVFSNTNRRLLADLREEILKVAKVIDELLEATKPEDGNEDGEKMTSLALIVSGLKAENEGFDIKQAEGRIEAKLEQLRK